MPTLTADDAARTLDLTGDARCFFRDSRTARGSVAHGRYDGHYGVVTVE